MTVQLPETEIHFIFSFCYATDIKELIPNGAESEYTDDSMLYFWRWYSTKKSISLSVDFWQSTTFLNTSLRPACEALHVLT